MEKLLYNDISVILIQASFFTDADTPHQFPSMILAPYSLKDGAFIPD